MVCLCVRRQRAVILSLPVTILFDLPVLGVGEQLNSDSVSSFFFALKTSGRIRKTRTMCVSLIGYESSLMTLAVVCGTHSLVFSFIVVIYTHAYVPATF